MKKLTTIATVLAGGALTVAPLFASAETNFNVSLTGFGTQEHAGASTSAPNGTLRAQLEAKTKANAQLRAEEHASSTMQKGETKGDKEIDMRISSLNALMTRIGNIARLTADEKATLSAEITNEINVLTQLKAQIAADTSTTTLKGDVSSITKANRVYALVIPQAQIAAASDRVLAVAAQFDAFAPKLQARITAAASAGADMTAAQNAYADISAKTADAKVQAQAAASETASLKPDNGDKTIFASNEQALKDARAKLKAAETDLKAARKDVMTIMLAVKGKGVGATASTTASTTVTH